MTDFGLEQIGASLAFGGRQLRYRHRSQVQDCDMTFSIFLPPAALAGRKVPAVIWLSGLTCTDENFVQKAGAQQWAARHQLAVIAPDTSPRGEHVPDDLAGSWDFGLGAGFYVDATREPYSRNYRMYSYITEELPQLLDSHFQLAPERSLMGHSMGGHGALTIALKNPGHYRAVSAFAPIGAPSQCPWGKKAFSGYLGEDRAAWAAHDTCALLDAGATLPPTWVEQGGADPFLSEQLQPELLLAACRRNGQAIHYREWAGYDHSYFFVATAIAEHFAYHALHLYG